MQEPTAPWDMPYAQPSRDGYKTAAIAMWITGAVLLITGGCLAGAFGLVASQSADQWIANIENLTPEQEEQFRQLHPILGFTALMVTALAVVPGLLLIAFAFGVRKGKRLIINIALVVCILLGIYNLLNLAGGLFSGNPAAMVMSFFVFGGILGLLIWCTISLLRARRQPALAVQDDEADPWETSY